MKSRRLYVRRMIRLSSLHDHQMSSMDAPLKTSGHLLAIDSTKKLKDRGKIAKYSPEKRFFRSVSPTPNQGISNHESRSQLGDNIDIVNESSRPTFDLTWNMLSNVHLESPLDTMTCNKLLKNLGNQGKLDKCELLFDFMVSNRIRRSIITFNTIISRAGSWKNIDVAEKYFEILKESSVRHLKPDEQIYNSMINAYSKSEMIDRAFYLFKEMQLLNITLSAVTFNTLLDACSRLGAVKKAEDVLSMMKLYNISPDVRTYSSLVHLRCAAGNITSALSILKEMEIQNMDPSPITYSIILDAFGRKGLINEAFKMLDIIRSKGITVNFVTLSSLLHSCAKSGRLNDAFLLYHDMLNSPESDRRPNSITCSALIDACLKVGEVDRAYGVLKDMNTFGIALTTVTYTSLITELTKLKMLDKILEFLMHETKDNPSFVEVKANPSFSFPNTAKTITNPSTHETTDTIRLQNYGSNLLNYFERIEEELKLLSQLLELNNAADLLELESYDIASVCAMANAFLNQSHSTSQIFELIRTQSESDADAAFDLSSRNREFLSNMFQSIVESQDKARRLLDAESLLSSKLFALSTGKAIGNNEDRAIIVNEIKSLLHEISQPSDMTSVFFSEYESLKVKGVSKRIWFSGMT